MIFISVSPGKNRNNAATVTTPMTATTAKAERQPTVLPSQVATGTPTTLATDKPSMVCPTALARSPGPARCAATSAATPKYAPCGSPATNLEAISAA